jgi:transcriptional regulator with PAS, ATPase and Fis domain
VPAAPNATSESSELRRDLDQIPDERIAQAWRDARYQAKHAAAALGVGVTYLWKRLETCAGVVLAKNLRAEEILGAWDALGGDLSAVARRLEVSKRALQLQITRLRLALPSDAVNDSSDEDGD